MKVILMHGKDATPYDKWYPWFKKEMEKHGIDVYVPELPSSSEPKCEDWLFVLEGLRPDEDTILIGHSRGGVAVLRYLECLPENVKVKKVILLATNSGLLKHKAIPQESNYGFYTEGGYDFERIKSHCGDFVVFHSEDDKWVPFEHGKQNAEKLDAKFITFKDKGHFGINDGNPPRLIEEIID